MYLVIFVFLICVFGPPQVVPIGSFLLVRSTSDPLVECFLSCLPCVPFSRKKRENNFLCNSNADFFVHGQCVRPDQSYTTVWVRKHTSFAKIAVSKPLPCGGIFGQQIKIQTGKSQRNVGRFLQKGEQIHASMTRVQMTSTHSSSGRNAVVVVVYRIFLQGRGGVAARHGSHGVNEQPNCNNK